MSVAVDRCATCGALVDVEDLFCANCGTEVPDARPGATAPVATEAKNYQCRGCGATMSYDASAQALKCPFCGSVQLDEEASRGVRAPEFVIPFAFERAEAEGRLRGWLGSSFWHPDDLRSRAQLAELKAVFVPFWIFTTRVSTHWTADTNRTPPGARADWFPVAGDHEREYADLWVPAGAGLPPGDLDAIGPFDPAAGLAPDRVNLDDVMVEQFSISRRYARPLAQGRLEALEVQAVAAELAGSSRNVHVNVLMHGASSRPALVPVYVLAYRYRGRLYRFVLNGQTGRSTGTAPLSVGKVAMVVSFFVLIAVLIALLFQMR